MPMLEEREQDGKEQGISQATVRNFHDLGRIQLLPRPVPGCLCNYLISVSARFFCSCSLSPFTEYDIFSNYSG